MVEGGTTVGKSVKISSLQAHQSHATSERNRRSISHHRASSILSVVLVDKRWAVNHPITLWARSDQWSRVVRRLEHGGMFGPAPFSASTYHLTCSSEEICMGFSPFFIRQATWFSASAPIIDPYTRNLIQGPRLFDLPGEASFLSKYPMGISTA